MFLPYVIYGKLLTKKAKCYILHVESTFTHPEY